MSKLHLLFTKDGLQYQMINRRIEDENLFFADADSPENSVELYLQKLLDQPFSEISVISALNRFTLMPEGFSDHEAGYSLIGFNAPVDEASEELMLSVNKKFGVQFYYTFPKSYYERIKAVKAPSRFNFSGEKFLNMLQSKGGKEIHINLYHHQCEFFALENRKVKLYNNLDVNSEVDFLYFIMFTLSKIGFGTEETQFFVYGETTENDTFISELRKFVRHLKISFDNLPKKNFILN